MLSRRCSARQCSRTRLLAMPSSHARAGPWPGLKLRRRRNAVAKTSAARSSANGAPNAARYEAVHDGKVDLETLLEICQPDDGLALWSGRWRWLGPLTLNDCQFARQMFRARTKCSPGAPPRATGQPESEGTAQALGRSSPDLTRSISKI